MKAIVTGGAGFIGSHVADALIENGHQAVVIDNLSSGRKENIPAKAKFYNSDITDPAAAEIFKEEKPDAVFHLAAQISVSASVKNPFYDMDINIKGTVHLLEAAVLTGVKKFIFSSTGGAIYGEHDYFPADENHPFRPLSPYGIGKLAAEKYIYYYHKLSGMNYTILRYSNVYGPRQDPYGEAGVVAIFAKKMIAGEEPLINGTGEQTRDFVFVKDVARANLIALEDQHSGEFNISTGKETTVNELFRIMASITGSPSPEKHGPALPGEQLRSVLSWEKAKNSMGWSPAVDIAQGLKETVDYFKKLST